MHEVGIISEALLQVSRIASSRQGRIEKVVMTVGRLSGADPDSLRFAFEALTPGGPAAGAELEIVPVEAKATCNSCGESVEADRWLVFRCPQCGSICSAISSGRELELTRIIFTQ